jgi:hypothetical protein
MGSRIRSYQNKRRESKYEVEQETEIGEYICSYQNWEEQQKYLIKQIRRNSINEGIIRNQRAARNLGNTGDNQVTLQNTYTDHMIKQQDYRKH